MRDFIVREITRIFGKTPLNIRQPLSVFMPSEEIVIGTSQNWKKEVEEAQLPVLVDFWAAWCGPCRMVSPVIDALGKKHEGKLKVVKVNVDENQDLAEKFGVMSIPTIMLFNGGKLVDSRIGAAIAEEYEDLLKINQILV